MMDGDIISHDIENNLKGALGEIFIEREFEEFNIMRTGYTNGGDCANMIKYLGGIEYFNGSYLKKKFGTHILPDFFIKEIDIFMEVKTGEEARLEKNQLEEFPKILKKGYRIFIVHPVLIIEKRKFEVTNFIVKEFFGKGKYEKIGLETFRRLVVQ